MFKESTAPQKRNRSDRLFHDLFNENEIKRIHLLRFSTYTEIEVITNDRIYNCGTATFKGIEWNYGGQVEDTLKDDEYIELSNKYQRLLNRNEELEEEHKELVETNYNLATKKTELEEDLDLEKSISSNLAQKILKAIEYIEEHSLNFNGECEIDLEVEECKDLIKILKGEENESN